MYQQQKRYNTAICRFQRHQTWHGVIKAEKDWRGVGWPQVAMHSQLLRFLVMDLTGVLALGGCSRMPGLVVRPSAIANTAHRR